MTFTPIKQFMTSAFAHGGAPHINTVRRLIRDGLLPGRRIGFRYYVDTLALEAGLDPVATRVLHDVRRAS